MQTAQLHAKEMSDHLRTRLKYHDIISWSASNSSLLLFHILKYKDIRHSDSDRYSLETLIQHLSNYKTDDCHISLEYLKVLLRDFKLELISR